MCNMIESFPDRGKAPEAVIADTLTGGVDSAVVADQIAVGADRALKKERLARGDGEKDVSGRIEDARKRCQELRLAEGTVDALVRLPDAREGDARRGTCQQIVQRTGVGLSQHRITHSSHIPGSSSGRLRPVERSGLR